MINSPYFITRFFGFTFGACGTGGVFNKFRSNASVRRLASALECRSSESISDLSVSLGLTFRLAM
jgi:hypothetical protein